MDEGASTITVSDVGEFGLIARVTQGLAPSPGTLLGPGDDAAVVAAPDGRVVVSTDTLLENRHFRRDWSSAEDVGHKAAARAFSDIAAMGARPTALVVALAAPGDLELTWIDGLMSGLRAECAQAEGAIVGGDVTAADTVMIGLTALGDLEGREPVTQAGARVGDLVAVCGRTGWAAAGFAVLSRGFRSPVQVVAAHRRPEPPYAQGPVAAQLGATSMTDLSDGLVGDLGHVAAASGVRIDLRAELLDVPAKLREVGAALNTDPLVWVLTGGDDYALAATFPRTIAVPAEWRVIGAVTEGEGVRVDGRRWSVGGHEHYR
ncbi:thiamine-phosphate kinase [uncultured Jatrophihabitans sp.]|uniref:thiamine-phosphate kinase n=1 Tax=uncultured Jatrophihabitans sp. TaxID=1610747 RepID=UPI0035CABC7A